MTKYLQRTFWVESEGKVQRGIALGVLMVDVGAAHQQQLHEATVVVLASHQQQRIALLVLKLNRGCGCVCVWGGGLEDG